MSYSGRQKVKNDGSAEFSQDVCDDGTSARTRPFSFDEVMLRRKNKEEIAVNNIIPEGTDNVSIGPAVEEVSEQLELNRNKRDDPIPSGMRHTSENSQRESSRKKENVSIKEDKLVRNADKGSRKPETNLDATRNKNVSSDQTMERKTDRRTGDRKKDEYSSDVLRKELVKRHSEDLVRKDRSGGKSRGKYEEERKSSYQAGDDDRQFRSKRKKDDQLSNDSENRSKKRDSKHLTASDNHPDRSRGKSEKEAKRKHQIEVEERVRDRYESRKPDLGKRQIPDYPEKKLKEVSKIRHEESKSRRRQSRSRERDQDRLRRSSSPKVQKHSSYVVQEHRDSATYSLKNRSGVLHSDTDRRRMSTNGSSGHYRRHAGSSSGLGGYSPRKRKSEAAARTPSPVRRSPEKRTAGWDLPPSGKRSNGTGNLVSSHLQSSGQNVSLSLQESPIVIPVTQESPSVIPVTSATSMPVEISYNFALSKINAVDSIQLTQATRPMRRLYIENLPASASEKDVMEWINNSLLSSGVNYIQGTQPCISCMIHKEKGQALLEFLTPEDASAALSFDGRSFCGSLLKLRRPKDFIDMTTGVTEKSLVPGNSVVDFVEDSPHKIFVGGISKVIPSEMLKEILRGFGQLKAYHFEVNADLMEPCAFLEYVDHSVTLKACAALNGMKLGGKVLTVVQAIPDDSQVVNVEHEPFYGIPEHAKPLLHKPTQVLKLKNVLDPEGLFLLSEAEADELLEDIKLECSRFGTVKSINIVKQSNSSSTTKTFHVTGNSTSVDGGEFHDGGRSSIREAESDHNEWENPDKSEAPSCGKEPEEVDKTSEDNSSDNKPCVPDPSDNCAEPEGIDKLAVCDSCAVDCLKDEMCEPNQDDRNAEVKEPTCQENSTAVSGGLTNQPSGNNDEIALANLEDHEMKKLSSTEEDLHADEKSEKLDAASHLHSNREKDLDTSEKHEDMEMDSNLGEIFEPGCVLVEFKREEAACKAAHCLHQRLFGNRIVTVGYVDVEVYRRRYPK